MIHFFFLVSFLSWLNWCSKCMDSYLWLKLPIYFNLILFTMTVQLNALPVVVNIKTREHSILPKNIPLECTYTTYTFPLIFRLIVIIFVPRWDQILSGNYTSQQNVQVIRLQFQFEIQRKRNIFPCPFLIFLNNKCDEKLQSAFIRFMENCPKPRNIQYLHTPWM